MREELGLRERSNSRRDLWNHAYYEIEDEGDKGSRIRVRKEMWKVNLNFEIKMERE